MKHDDQPSLQDRVADAITRASGSMWFVYLHVAWFGVWLVWNLSARFTHFDPFPFGLLTMIVSLEAIFLATFIMISQNRAEERRAAIAAQAEAHRSEIADHDHEVDCASLEALKLIAEKMGIELDTHGR